MRLAALLAGVAAMLPEAGALAQDAPPLAQGWDFDPGAASGRATVASLTFESGAGVAVQCHRGLLNTAILGLPAAAPGEINAYGQRGLTVLLNGEPVQQSWRASPGSTTAVAAMPGRLARRLKVGGTLSVVTVPGDSGALVRRFEISIPADPASIDRVLEDCGAPGETTHDAVPFVDPADLTEEVWRGAHLFLIRNIDREGRAEVSCVFAPEGRVRDCVVESESTRGLGRRIIHNQGRVRFPFAPEVAQRAEGRLIYLAIIQTQTDGDRR